LLRDQAIEGKKTKVFAYKMVKEYHIKEGRLEKKYKIKKRKKNIFPYFLSPHKIARPHYNFVAATNKKPTSIFNPLLLTHSPTNQTN
jgi:hypothetical protein